MEIIIYDAKIRQDDQSKQILENPIAALYFYHGTVLKVSKIFFCQKYQIIKNKIHVKNLLFT